MAGKPLALTYLGVKNGSNLQLHRAQVIEKEPANWLHFLMDQGGPEKVFGNEWLAAVGNPVVLSILGALGWTF